MGRSPAMARHPHHDGRVDAIRPSVFARLVRMMDRIGAPKYPLHIGDTCLDPPAACRMEALAADPPTRPYDYSHPFGTPALRDALADKVRRHNGLDWAGPDHVQITNGATHALFVTCQALFGPGDEVIIPSPHWPLISGIVAASGATPVLAPFWPELAEDSADNCVQLLTPYLSDRTAGLYVNTPNNPTGRCLSAAALQRLVDLAVERNLWLLSDEAYEHYAFGAVPHVSTASLPGAAERTVTAWTLSKSYALAGYRAGYLCGPDELVAHIRRLCNHSVYSVGSFVQEAAVRAFEHGDDWLLTAKAAYADGAALVAGRLKGRFRPAEGAGYVWLQIDRDGWEFLEDCLQAGVSLAPGAGFGDGFDRAMRLCYVACDLDALAAGVDALNRVLEA